MHSRFAPAKNPAGYVNCLVNFRSVQTSLKGQFSFGVNTRLLQRHVAASLARFRHTPRPKSRTHPKRGRRGLPLDREPVFVHLRSSQRRDNQVHPIDHQYVRFCGGVLAALGLAWLCGKRQAPPPVPHGKSQNLPLIFPTPKPPIRVSQLIGRCPCLVAPGKK